MEDIKGSVDIVTYSNDETGYRVIKVSEPGKQDKTVIVGVMPDVQVGESIECEGTWGMHPSHGLQFKVSQVRVIEPSDQSGIEAYLASGLIKGIGPVYAKRIVTIFKENTLDILDKDPKKLNMVPGIGRSRLAAIQASWIEHRSIRKLMIVLQALGIGASLAHRIHQMYGEASMSVIQETPYQLCQDIWGVGFLTADRIAQHQGLSARDPQRIQAGIAHILEQLSTQGHTCYPKQELCERTTRLLQLPLHDTELVLDQSIQKGILIEHAYEPPRIALPEMDRAERSINQDRERIASYPILHKMASMDSEINKAESNLGIELAQKQREAGAMALSEPFSIITGGPGTGKSTITQVIIEVLKKHVGKIKCAAPTGRAAKRIREITGVEASTIHSLLEVRGLEFAHNHEKPLRCDYLIIDEASMIDTALMAGLLAAVPDHAQLLMIGDVNQLPSVGPGRILSDLITGETIKVTELTDIYRQAAGSNIIRYAHAVNNAQPIRIQNHKDSDCFFLEAQSAEAIQTTIKELVSTRLPNRYGWDPIQDIHVLTPQNKGPIGTESLNQVLQDVLNPEADGLDHKGQRLGLGDKVMQLKNNYQKNTLNGDVGIIQEWDVMEQEITVQYADHEVAYISGECDELKLAYATTIHKSQGSEYPCVIIPVHSSHQHMLQRNLLYTAMTRGKKMVILVGQTQTFQHAITKADSETRYTALNQ